MDLAEALAWLDSHVNHEAASGGPPRAGSIGGLSLDRMSALVEVLDHPQRQYPVLHVTGTNGKGSVARMASALLAECGLAVGTYTSPHLARLNERIARNGDPIPDDDLAGVLSDLAVLAPLAGEGPSWFELMTAAAFRWFAEVAVDVAVVEVGMLGRFDATNVAEADVAVVTNIGPDHTDFQGDWRRAIAWEKAGIVKPSSTLVLGETDPALGEVFASAGAAEVLSRGPDFDCDANTLAVGGRQLDLRTPAGTVSELFIPAHGAHQGDNAACALTAVEALLGQRLGDDVVREGFAAVKLPARFEIASRSPLVVIDAAHNPGGAAVAGQTLGEDFEVAGEVILVVGMLAPRDPEAFLDALDAGSAHLVVACQADSPRAIPAAEIGAAAARLGVPAEVVPDVGRAIDRAMRRATEDDAVLICGSTYVAGAARTHLRLR